jgi:hypothetical protein
MSSTGTKQTQQMELFPALPPRLVALDGIPLALWASRREAHGIPLARH